MNRVHYADGSHADIEAISLRTMIACEQEYQAPFDECQKYLERTAWMYWHELHVRRLTPHAFGAWLTTVERMEHIPGEDEAGADAADADAAPLGTPATG